MATSISKKSNGDSNGTSGITYFEIDTTEHDDDDDNDDEYFDDDDDEYIDNPTSAAFNHAKNKKLRRNQQQQQRRSHQTTDQHDKTTSPEEGVSLMLGRSDSFDDGFNGQDGDVDYSHYTGSIPPSEYWHIAAASPYRPFLGASAVVVIILLAAALFTPTSPKVELHRHCQADYTRAFAPSTAASTSTTTTTWNDMVQYYLTEQDQKAAATELTIPPTLPKGNPLVLFPPTRCFTQIPAGKQCSCENPVVGAIPSHRSSWLGGFDANLKLVQQENRTALDVVMVGDSITEHWQGTSMGQPSIKYADNLAVYQELFVHTTTTTSTPSEEEAAASSGSGFTTSSSLPIEGLALGISGDRTPQVLYRLENGFLNNSFLQPKVWWILIGTNDLAFGDWCAVDAVVAGNIRIAQVILQARPHSTVVINSIFPLGNSQGLRDWYGYYDQVNHRLECFAASTDRVEFFNGTSLFLNHETATVANTATSPSVNESLLPDGGHPNGDASRIWGAAIIEKVKEVTGRAVYQKPSGAAAANNDGNRHH